MEDEVKSNIELLEITREDFSTKDICEWMAHNPCATHVIIHTNYDYNNNKAVEQFKKAITDGLRAMPNLKSLRVIGDFNVEQFFPETKGLAEKDTFTFKITSYLSSLVEFKIEGILKCNMTQITWFSTQLINNKKMNFYTTDYMHRGLNTDSKK
jgi:hypothetical protein